MCEHALVCACSEEELHNLRHLFPQEGLKTLNLALLFKSPGTQKGAKVTLNLKRREILCFVQCHIFAQNNRPVLN